MKTNVFTQISKKLLLLAATLGISTFSVSPTLADNHTDSMETDSQMEMPMEESTTDMEESTTDMEESTTDMEESTTDMEESTTDMEESTTDMEESTTDMEESTTDMEESTTDMEESTTDMEESTTDMEESTTDMEESTTDMEESTAEVGNIVEVASGNESFNTLVQAIEAAGLTDTLSDSSASYTVFAPTDEAFNQLPEGTLEYLLKPENKEVLQQVLLYHVLPNKVTSSEISGGNVETLKGGIATAVTDKGVVINNASVVTPDIQANNGVIHVINRVLLPANLQTSLASELGIDEANIYQQ